MPPVVTIARRSPQSPIFLKRSYCLAVLEQDDGNAAAAHAQALNVVEATNDDTQRSAARSIAAAVGRFAR